MLSRFAETQDRANSSFQIIPQHLQVRVRPADHDISQDDGFLCRPIWKQAFLCSKAEEGIVVVYGVERPMEPLDRVVEQLQVQLEHCCFVLE
jgi:hypothetical protein